MKSPHILNTGSNVRKVKENLAKVLDAAGLQAIEDEIIRNVRDIFRLAVRQHRFASKLAVADWRQAVSRHYYAAYNSARAVRLLVTGDYRTDVEDHRRFDRLPDDFPSRDRFVNQLQMLREDRNLCDYDHTVSTRDLVLGRPTSQKLVSEFIQQVEKYLQSKGVVL